MTTLREEIYEYLGNDKIATDEIISKIEKRIDLMLIDVKPYCSICSDEKSFWIKKEMLK